MSIYYRKKKKKYIKYIFFLDKYKILTNILQITWVISYKTFISNKKN